MLRLAIAIGFALLSFVALTAISMGVDVAVRPWSGHIVETLSPTGVLLTLFVIIPVVGWTGAYLLQRRHERREYAATGIITVERPHPWPMWLRALALTPL